MLSISSLLNTLNVMASSVLVILAFALLAYTLTYNFRNTVARFFAFVLLCVAIVYAGDVALDRVTSAASAGRWLRFQWLGIAWMPAACYLFSLSVLAATNYRVTRRRWVGGAMIALSGISALDAIFGRQVAGEVLYAPPLSYLQAGPWFGLFTLFYSVAVVLSLGNIWKARRRCLTATTRLRMTYLLIAFLAPGVAVFPYLIAVSRAAEGTQSGNLVLVISLLGNLAIGFMLLLMSYTVAFFGVVTPDRVVRYRLLRFFMRGPLVAILVILAIQVLPKVESLLGLPRDVVLFGVITAVIVFSQLILSVTKGLVDRLIYREDRDEIAWLREVDRRLLTTSDLRQLLENNLAALCELLRVPDAFVAAAVGPDLILEAVVGQPATRAQVLATVDWTDGLSRAIRTPAADLPTLHNDFWLWPLTKTGEEENGRVYGLLGVRRRDDTTALSYQDRQVLATTLDRITLALADRKLQQSVLASLRYLIPDIDRVQQLRNVVPYALPDSARAPAAALLDPSPIHSPEFEAWVKDALSHYWGGPKFSHSPLMRLHIVSETLRQAEDDPTRALRLVLGQGIERLRPEGKQNFTAPEWLLYNILELRFVQGRKVREIADRLAISESDLYRKQRVAIGQLARVLTEMEQDNAPEN